MIKHEIKIEYPHSEKLQEIIQKSYFDEGYLGKILNKNYYLTITPQNDETLYTILKGLNNVTTKITNEIIDGSARFIIEEDQPNNQIKLYPISTYCIKENNKFIFY